MGTEAGSVGRAARSRQGTAFKGTDCPEQGQTNADRGAGSPDPASFRPGTGTACHDGRVTSGLRRDLTFVLVLGLFMVVSRQFVLPGSSIAVLWPAAGVALLWLHSCLPSPGHTARAVVVIFAGSVVIRLLTGGGWWDSTLIGAGHTVQAYVSARLLIRAGEPLHLAGPGDLGRLLLVVAGGTLAGALIAGPALWLLPEDGSALAWVAAWSARNAAGALTMTALGLLLGAGAVRAGLRDLTRPQTWVVLLLLLAGLVTFQRVHVPLAFTVLPVLAWLALRVHTVTALTISGVTSVVILLLDLRGFGPYSGTSAAIQLLYLQLVFVVLGALVLTLSLYRDQHDQLLAQLLSTNRETHNRALMLERQTHVDPLTGAANRRGLAAVLESQDWPVGECGVLYVDLDRFKPVNDLYGHAAGDAVLIEVTGRLSGQVRGSDVVCRLGGDEFAVVCHGISLPDLQRLGRRLVTTICEPIQLPDAEVSVGASIGLTVGRPEDDLDTLLARADRAMYEAKSSGRGRAVAG